MKKFISLFSIIITIILLFGYENIAFAQFSESKILHINNKSLDVEVAKNETSRQKGLMFRTTLETNSGMLFIFDRPTTSCMWMKNTLIPLSVAFVDSDGFIINIENMQPLSLDNHCAKRPAKYAIEANINWFENNNIKADDFVKNLQ